MSGAGNLTWSWAGEIDRSPLPAPDAVETVTRRTSPLMGRLGHGVAAGQTFQHQAGHRHIDPRLFRLRPLFIVLAQSARPVQPAKGAFDDPAFRHHLKADGVVRALDNAQHPATRLLDPIAQLRPAV